MIDLTSVCSIEAPLRPIAPSTGEQRVHLMPRVAFAHVAVHRCGVFVPRVGDVLATRMCEQPPLYGAQIALSPERSGYLAVCDQHADDARSSWPDLLQMWSLR